MLKDVADDEDEDERLKEAERCCVIPLATDGKEDAHGVDRDVGDAKPEDEQRAPGEVE
jgi:hypothetical protein